MMILLSQPRAVFLLEDVRRPCFGPEPKNKKLQTGAWIVSQDQHLIGMARHELPVTKEVTL